MSKDPTKLLPLGTCLYEHTFVVFMGADIKRYCILDKDHEGNHVVQDPKGELLEVPRK